MNALGLGSAETAQNYYNRFQTKLKTTDISQEELEIPEEFIYQDDTGQEQIIPAHTSLTLEQVKIIVEKSKEKLLKKLRYGKVLIMTDADEDEIYKQENKKVAGGNLQRFKGLGEMNPKQLREVTMGAETRLLPHKLNYSNFSSLLNTVQDLMGPKSEPRKKLLDSGEYEDVQLEVIDGKVDIEQALRVKFSSYAYEVVRNRALTQLQDGLKPVQRYILYTLYELGFLPNKPHRKSARVVGDVIGKYHPHGDQSAYQAMVKMAQDFNYRYPLIDGQDNHDNSEKEPEVLPPHLNLLLNGSSGIAVGMSADIPPHNLGEVVDLTIALVNNPQLDTEKLLSYFGPDFPTGGQVLEQEKLLEIYEKGEVSKGKGTIYIRAKAEIISSKQEKEKKDLIRITELPFKINKSKLVVNISQIIKDKKILGLKSVADYSNYEEPVNIHCYFDPNYDGEVILNQLYKKTRLQSTFSFKMRSLIGYQPKVFSLKEIIQGFIDRKLENIQKKAQFIYYKAQKELINKKTRHFIIKNYQGIAQIIHSNASEEESKKQLINKFREEITELKDTTVDLFLMDLIIKSEKTIGEIKVQSQQKNEVTKKEKCRELVEIEKSDDIPNLLEDDYLNPEQKVINRILDTPASFRQFTPEKQKELQSEIEVLKANIIQQQLLIVQQEQRKQQLISELVELKKEYSHDQRRTIITSQPHSIAERQLIPHEERIVLLSRSENKKENKINNYLTVHSLSAVEPTNIPSQDEEYFTKIRKGELKPTLKSSEFFTAALPVKEEFTEKSLLIITQKGKIKLIPTEKLQNISKSGKKLINLYQKTIEKCSLHQSQLTEHKSITHVCGIGCQQLREIQKQIKDCVEIILKRKAKGGQVKNLKVPLYRQMRRKDKEGNSLYCPVHQNQLKKHKTANCCDKSQGVKAYSRCLKFRKLTTEIKDCQDCQNPQLFAKQTRKQVKCEQVVDLLIIKAGENKENLLLFLIKKDNVEKLEKVQEKIETELRKEKEIAEERVLKSTLPLEIKEKILKDSKIITGVNTKEMEKKIANSPVDLTIGEVAIATQTQDLKQKGAIYQKKLNEYKNQHEKISDFKEKNKKCSDCQKYCGNHEKKTQEEMIKHETCHHCHKYDKQIQSAKEKVEEIKEKLEELKKTKPGAVKEIQKLTNDLEKKKEQSTKLRHEVLGNRTKCPTLNKLKLERKDCKKCQDQDKKKHKALFENPLQHLYMFSFKSIAELLAVFPKEQTIIKYLEKHSVKTGTAFANTKLKLRDWFIASYLFTSHKKGISSCQLAKDLNITQKSAYYLLDDLRSNLKQSNFINEMLKGIIEIDETYVGGSNPNRH
ncbi:19188_t:CDS:10 [Entrophospora sp. SA101]|nr:19188_t:CDS:10 [Entrophospora sp. SA101]